MFARWIEMFIYLVFLIHLRPKCPWWSTGGWLVENNKELQQNFLSLRFWQANSILPETLILRKNVPRTFFPLNRALAYDVESEYFELSPNTRIIGNWHRMRKFFYMLIRVSGLFKGSRVNMAMSAWLAWLANQNSQSQGTWSQNK